MEMTQLIWLLRILGGLAIGFILARKLRDFIRSIVIMCIPMKHRISEQSFQIQTRITTAVGILVAIGIAIGLNYGLSVGMDKMGVTKTIKLSDAGLSPSLPIKNKPVVVEQPPQPTLPKVAPEFVLPIVEEPDRSVVPPTYEIPSQQKATRPKVTRPIAPPTDLEIYHNQRYPAPQNWQAPRATANAYQMTYYAQLYAFRNLQNAKKQQLRWKQHNQIPVWVGFTEGEWTPYKVIVGPFKNRQAAAYFLKTNRLKGFPKPAHQLQVFQE